MWRPGAVMDHVFTVGSASPQCSTFLFSFTGDNTSRTVLWKRALFLARFSMFIRKNWKKKKKTFLLLKNNKYQKVKDLLTNTHLCLVEYSLFGWKVLFCWILLNLWENYPSVSVFCKINTRCHCDSCSRFRSLTSSEYFPSFFNSLICNAASDKETLTLLSVSSFELETSQSTCSWKTGKSHHPG